MRDEGCNELYPFFILFLISMGEEFERKLKIKHRKDSKGQETRRISIAPSSYSHSRGLSVVRDPLPFEVVLVSIRDKSLETLSHSSGH